MKRRNFIKLLAGSAAAVTVFKIMGPLPGPALSVSQSPWDKLLREQAQVKDIFHELSGFYQEYPYTPEECFEEA